jgi:hypothetical protein
MSEIDEIDSSLRPKSVNITRPFPWLEMTCLYIKSEILKKLSLPYDVKNTFDCGYLMRAMEAEKIPSTSDS